jgi:Rab GDP dissociation inhibitor
MDEEYDYIILGTGLKECVLSGILSKEGKKVLHMDRNDYYGGACASITPLEKVFGHFKKDYNKETAEAKFGRGRDYNVDLIPKFLMANGSLVKALVYSGVTRYLEFKSVEGSYVYKEGGNVWKVPATPREALTSSLMGIFQKNRFKNFLKAIYEFREDDKATWHKYIKPDKPMSEIYSDYGLDANTADFVGHALALYKDDTYKAKPCLGTILKIQLYADSVARYGSSPYLYPLYGLGELPQGFARLSAIYGGTYMLHRDIEGFEYDEAGRVTAVRAPDPDDEAQTVKAVKCKNVIGDPSYFTDKVKKIGQVARAICILDHPLPASKGSHPSGGAMSAQIIVPANQISPIGSKKNDVYVCCVSSAHSVAPGEKFVALVSTMVESGNAEAELKVGMDLCGPILETFLSVDDMYAPNGDGSADGIFISTSYDATTHFETTFDDINSLYKRATGNELDLTAADVEEVGQAGEGAAP